jgi:hypothetical protein
MTLQTEERILYCGTYDEYYYIIIDKIGTKYRINIVNDYIYFVDHIYDVGQKFIKYVKIMINLLYKRFDKDKKQYNKFDLLYYNIMLLDKTNVEESNKILKYLKISDLIECKSNLLDTYLYNKIVVKCNLKNNMFILTNNILHEIQYKYKINIESNKQACYSKLIKDLVI